MKAPKVLTAATLALSLAVPGCRAEEPVCTNEARKERAMEIPLVPLDVTEFLDSEIPRAQLEGINGVFITERPPLFPDSLAAIYLREQRIIIFFQIYTRGQMQSILTHEIGHHVCSENSEDDKLPAVFGSGERQIVQPTMDFISVYSQKNPHEDCAETFRAFHDLGQVVIDTRGNLKFKMMIIRRWHNQAKKQSHE